MNTTNYYITDKGIVKEVAAEIVNVKKNEIIKILSYNFENENTPVNKEDNENKEK